jgi:hypothetical protein
MSVLPDTLLRAIMARPASERSRLIAEWAQVLTENEARAERIRAQTRRGFIRYARQTDDVGGER